MIPIYWPTIRMRGLELHSHACPMDWELHTPWNYFIGCAGFSPKYMVDFFIYIKKPSTHWKLTDSKTNLTSENFTCYSYLEHACQHATDSFIPFSFLSQKPSRNEDVTRKLPNKSPDFSSQATIFTSLSPWLTACRDSVTDARLNSHTRRT